MSKFKTYSQTHAEFYLYPNFINSDLKLLLQEMYSIRMNKIGTRRLEQMVHRFSETIDMRMTWSKSVNDKSMALLGMDTEIGIFPASGTCGLVDFVLLHSQPGNLTMPIDLILWYASSKRIQHTKCPIFVYILSLKPNMRTKVSSEYHLILIRMENNCCKLN